MARKLQILMPMAGLGSRFTKAGIHTPKPMIEVDGIAMFLKALSSVSSIGADKVFFFVIRQEHVDTQHLDRLIKGVLPEAKIIIIPKMTRGAVETALAARNQLNLHDALIIMDCDLWFRSTAYNQMVEDSINKAIDIAGGLLTFESSDPRYSYAKVHPDMQVTKTAEKKVISKHAIGGAFFFATAKNFVASAQSLLQLPISDKIPEYYLSLLYNVLIDEGEKIQAATADEFASFGTPEELERYNKSSRKP